MVVNKRPTVQSAVQGATKDSPTKIIPRTAINHPTLRSVFRQPSDFGGTVPTTKTMQSKARHPTLRSPDGCFRIQMVSGSIRLPSPDTQTQSISRINEKESKKMSHILKAMLFAAVLLLPLTPSSRPQEAQNAPACAMVRQALTAYQQIKVGSTRADVERYFIRDGGAQFRQNTRYVYRQCSYLHLDVDFEEKGEAGTSLSPEDKVARVSKLYVDYAAKD
jgi:hypothetical protein